MINTLLVAPEVRSANNLQDQLLTYCPQVQISGMAFSLKEASQLIVDHSPELVFLEIPFNSRLKQFAVNDLDVEIIVVSATPTFSEQLLQMNAGSYLFKPVQAKALVTAVHQAQHWIRLKRQQLETCRVLQKILRLCPPNDLIGIPGMDGIEFLKTEEIIRCEALQKFTRVIISSEKDIISAYNIGQFCKLLGGHGFFSPHRSHLINLRHLRKFHTEGTIYMRDGSTVPIARRRRAAFLKRIKHL